MSYYQQIKRKEKREMQQKMKTHEGKYMMQTLDLFPPHQK